MNGLLKGQELKKGIFHKENILLAWEKKQQERLCWILKLNHKTLD